MRCRGSGEDLLAHFERERADERDQYGNVSLHPRAARALTSRAARASEVSADNVGKWLALAAGGSCNICGDVGTIAVPEDQARVQDPATLRESLACRSCGSISRDRALILGLAGLLGERAPLADWSPRPNSRVFETSGYRGHPRFMPELFDYFNLPFEPPPKGDSERPVDARAGADIQDLHFPDGFFDIVMTAEVLEHVAYEQRAISEIARVLAPGGHLILEVPYVHGWERTSVRVHRWHGRDVYLAPPEYHAEQTLVYRIYGRDLLIDLAAAGLAVAHLVLEVPRLGISRQTVIVATKGPSLDLGGFRFDSWLGPSAG